MQRLKTLAIVGSDPASRHLAPFDKPEIDIWVFNEAGNHEWCKRWNAVFQMHDPNIYKGHNTKDPKHWEWLQQSHGKPVYMQAVDPLVPDSVRYPIEFALSIAGAEMFSTTFAYMAALAILQGYERIEIHGMGLSASEYDYQKFGYAYWMGLLRGKLGAENVVNTITHIGRDILHSPRYGYEGNFSFGVEYFAGRAQYLKAEFEAADKSLTNIRKAIGKAIEKKEFDEARSLITQYQDAATIAGQASGALSEAERYQTFGSRYADRGGFENSAAKAQREGETIKPTVYHFGGVIEYVWNVWKQYSSPASAQQLQSYISKMGEQAYRTGAMFGIYRENVEYINKYDAIALAGGGVLLRNDA